MSVIQTFSLLMIQKPIFKNRRRFEKVTENASHMRLLRSCGDASVLGLSVRVVLQVGVSGYGLEDAQEAVQGGEACDEGAKGGAGGEARRVVKRIVR
jgi:hypothetical protein